MADRRPRRVERRDGYLPIEDYGLIGDGATGALVGRDGSIDWLCVPRFDGQPLFCGLLDSRRGGSFRVAPAELRAAGQRYETDTDVLVTELYAAGGVVEITDALTLRSGADLSEDLPAARGELFRYQGRLDAAVELFSSLCSRSNHLGLLPEQIDPSTGALCGNYPQGLSHVGLISTAINLNRQFARREA